MLDRITVQLPIPGLLFWKLSGREALSEPFELNVTLLSTDARIDRSSLLGQPITVAIPTRSLMGKRYLNGKITRVAVNAVELSGTRYAEYRLTMEPDLWPMKRDRNLRIFQGQTVPQIVKSLLGESQVNVEDRLTGSYRPWEYCVQYQESSLAFISRLMELEGIAYHFSHEADKHTLVLTDAPLQQQPFSGYESIPYHVTPSGGSTDEEGISQWALEDSVTPGIYSLDDYDFRKPNAWLFQARQNPASPSPGSIDVYDWPGRYVEHGHGEFYARIRQERWQVDHQQIQGTGTAVGLAPGYTFALLNAPFFSDNGEYLTTAVHYQFEENRYASGDSGGSVHRLDFSVIPSSVVFRPEQATPWPRTYGPQTAKVVGPQGESIWTDKYGRVKVKFHWDRLANGDDTSSGWVRVSSAWAGQGFGGVQIPRVGDEVVIDFINGDPDRPIVTGRVYNEASMPPWALPAAATQMGFMTRSKNGHLDNSSHLYFEDKPGAEMLSMHAEKDMRVSVENNKDVTIDGTRTTTILKEQKDDVTGDATFYYKSKRTTNIGKEQKDDVMGDAMFDYHSTRITTVYKNETKIFKDGEKTTITNGRDLQITSGGDLVNIKDKRDTTITGDENHHVTGKITQKFDGGQVSTIKGSGKTETITSGGLTVNVNGGDWTQKVPNGKVEIYSPQVIHIKSDSEVNIDAPRQIATAKGYSIGFTGANLSFNALSVGITGVQMNNNPITIHYDNGFKARVAGVQWDSLAMTVQAAGMFMFV
ncbi:type VI secretion system Vgr family protein [Serratia rubidaea]|uniref:type VI secretion system Vgr family protein n=1 Tax=Serratia rubidaea TaxID=61652 RepID=UPI0022B93C71|nr:type VI secretion system tip protein TssI/VgrG [Serratia rubidaea]WBF45533.1 type VI secretion system tip protein TssI/VgrG [Serratia rubidaea]